MVIVPREILEKLQNGVSESESSKLPFDFDDFIKTVDHESKIRGYLEDKNIEFVGTGTSRTAFLIPKGSCVDAKDRNVCFKIAKNLTGVKQNQTEKSLIDKYGKDNECFVKMFKYDHKRNLCLESEIGSPLKQYDLEEYFLDWNHFMQRKNSEQPFIEKISSLFSSYKNLKKTLSIKSFENLFDILYAIKNFKNLSKDLVVNESSKNHEKLFRSYLKYADIYLESVKECAKEHTQYTGLASLFHLLFDLGAEAELRIGEFKDPDNFAMVYRDNSKPTLIPIDYGMTYKVFQDFYGLNSKAEYKKHF